MFITVYTPTFNRAYRLPFLYESLKRQAIQDFEWLVVDDGSTDNTKDLVLKWAQEASFCIRYIAQDNQGVVAAHNTALMNIDSGLAVCVDSDDFLTDKALQTVKNYWSVNADRGLMGVVGLDVYKDGRVVGDKFPEELAEIKFSDIKEKYGIGGDKKYVFNVDCVKEALPYPVIPGERFPVPSLIFLLVEHKFKFGVINEPLCVVEYLPDGISMNKMRQYIENPNAFAYYRRIKIEKAGNLQVKLRNTVHYVSSKFLGSMKGMFADVVNPFMVFALLPVGLMLSLYIRMRSGGPVNRKLNK